MNGNDEETEYKLLVAKAKAGDKRAFESLWEKTKDRCRRAICRILKEKRQDVEDVLQTVALRLWDSGIHGYEGRNSAHWRTYACATAGNVAKTHLKQPNKAIPDSRIVSLSEYSEGGNLETSNSTAEMKIVPQSLVDVVDPSLMVEEEEAQVEANVLYDRFVAIMQELQTEVAAGQGKSRDRNAKILKARFEWVLDIYNDRIRDPGTPDARAKAARAHVEKVLSLNGREYPTACDAVERAAKRLDTKNNTSDYSKFYKRLLGKTKPITVPNQSSTKPDAT